MVQDRDFAVVIGVEHYKGVLQPLGGPHRDTKDFVHWLIAPDGGGLPDNGAWSTAESDASPSPNILLLLSTPNYTPIKDDVDDWMDTVMNSLLASGNRGRRLYFYFSGHGIGDTQMNSAMLLPKWTLSYRQYALSSEKYILELVKKGVFGEILFFMDCCRNRISGVQGQGPHWSAALPSSASSNYLIYYASEFDNPAWEIELAKKDGALDNLLPRGLFTEVLLRGLKGAAADREGNLRIRDLVSYVGKKLPELAISKGKTQIPRSVVSTADGEQNILGPFDKMVETTIRFKTAGHNMVLEDPELEIVKAGSSSDVEWKLSLQRGVHTLRNENEVAGQQILVDGVQTLFEYE